VIPAQQFEGRRGRGLAIARFGLADRRGEGYGRGMESSGNRMARGALNGSLLVVLVWMLAGCDNAVSSGKAGSTPATAPLDYLAAQGQAKKHSEKVVSLAQVQQALQQFQASEDRWPKDLQELVKAGFLAAVPVAPSGQRVVYDSSTGTVRMVRVQP
jgi:hypothetical protein